jgi:hypothetical protein
VSLSVGRRSRSLPLALFRGYNFRFQLFNVFSVLRFAFHFPEAKVGELRPHQGCQPIEVWISLFKTGSHNTSSLQRMLGMRRACVKPRRTSSLQRPPPPSLAASSWAPLPTCPSHWPPEWAQTPTSREHPASLNEKFLPPLQMSSVSCIKSCVSKECFVEYRILRTSKFVVCIFP